MNRKIKSYFCLYCNRSPPSADIMHENYNSHSALLIRHSGSFLDLPTNICSFSYCFRHLLASFSNHSSVFGMFLLGLNVGLELAGSRGDGNKILNFLSALFCHRSESGSLSQEAFVWEVPGTPPLFVWPSPGSSMNQSAWVAFSHTPSAA